MIGTRIESSPSLSTWTLILGAGWVTSLALAIVFHNVHYAIGGTPLACYALVRLLYRERRVCLEVEHEGLSLNDSLQTISYSSIRSLSPDPKQSGRSQFVIDVIHTGGVFTIPASIDHSSEDLLDFLRSRLAPQPQGFVHPALQDHLLRQLELFGPEKVFCFTPRESVTPIRRGTTQRGIGLAMMASGILWGLAGAISEEWIISGIIVFIFGGIFFLASYARRDASMQAVKNWRESTLIVTPTGIALAQGDLKGKLRWDEVLNVKLAGTAKFSMTPVVPGLTLQVAGSQILIQDLYNEALPVIHQRISDYFSGQDD